MTERTKAIVVAIKNKDGDDILGWYCGESTTDESYEPCIVLYRPIYVKLTTRAVDDISITSYLTGMYFAYGSQMVNIPYSSILNKDIASDFFTIFYTRTISDMIAKQDTLQESYTKFWTKQDTTAAMKNTDSIFVDHVSEVLQ